MNLGFTGTRQVTTQEQNTWLLKYMLDNPAEEFHHGCCVGADAQAHRTAKACLDLGLGQIVLHPPMRSIYEMDYTDWDYANCVWYPKKEYILRNHDIVDNTDRLIALPEGEETRRSGTWSTVRYAVMKRKPVLICHPDGQIEERTK